MTGEEVVKGMTPQGVQDVVRQRCPVPYLSERGTTIATQTLTPNLNATPTFHRPGLLLRVLVDEKQGSDAPTGVVLCPWWGSA